MPSPDFETLKPPFAIRHSKLYLVTLSYMWILFILSSLPGGEGGHLMDLMSPTLANIAHVPAYGLLALLWIFTLRDHGVAVRRSMWVAFFVASGCGALTELHQFWVPGRFPSILDVMSNTFGSLLFVGLYWQARGRCHSTPNSRRTGDGRSMMHKLHNGSEKNADISLLSRG